MAKGSPKLEWCIVRLGEDHNWWVDEVSDPVHWDVDGLSIIDPRQVDHIIELIDPLREYGFDQDIFERAFIPFRIAKDLGKGKVRLSRIKQPLLESEEKLFALPDVIDEENGPYADFLDHITRLRVKMLNEILDLEEKLTVDEVEDQIREAQNSDFIEGKAVHLFSEITAILDYTPEGHGDEDEDGEKVKGGDEEEADVPEVDEEEDEKMKNDSSLKWDEDDEDGDDDEEGEKKGDGDEDEEDEDDEGEDSDDAEEGDEKPRSSRRGR
ncbi:MAG TPA: hypothetical protein VG734_00555 [Lacunisphaera sp.]|nr:hypothetical protein [Lacunisphaera sp.]